MFEAARRSGVSRPVSLAMLAPRSCARELCCITECRPFARGQRRCRWPDVARRCVEAMAPRGRHPEDAPPDSCAGRYNGPRLPCRWPRVGAATRTLRPPRRRRPLASHAPAGHPDNSRSAHGIGPRPFRRHARRFACSGSESRAQRSGLGRSVDRGVCTALRRDTAGQALRGRARAPPNARARASRGGGGRIGSTRSTCRRPGWSRT